MTSPLERAATALTATLRHHGVEMHPDDIRGLAIDAITAIREPSEGMVRAGAADVGNGWTGPHSEYTSLHGCTSVYQAMIDAALREGG